IYWFAASFSVLALDMMLLALLAAQHWRQTGRREHLLLCVLCCALAPAWFRSGVLAGALSVLYLLPQSGRGWQAWSKALEALVPLLGTAAFVAVSIPRTAEYIMHLEHYGKDQTAASNFNPLGGLVYTCRAVVENLALGAVGISGVSVPLALVPI